MTLATPDSAAPRAPGSPYGAHGCDRSEGAHCYGQPGDRCACGGLLSAYNPRDRCNLCGGGKKRPRRRGASTSAYGEAVTTAAPAPRHNSQEEIEMAARERRHYGVCKELIAEFMSDGEWHGGAEVCKGANCASSTATFHMQTGAECGQYETRPATKGGFQYRLRRDAAARAAEARVHDDGPCPVSDPDCEGEEDDCHDACEPIGTGGVVEGPPPFGNLEEARLEFSARIDVQTSGDVEVDAISACVEALKPLDDVAIVDILDHLARRFVLRKRAAQ